MEQKLYINTNLNFFPETKTSFALLFSSPSYSNKDKGLPLSETPSRGMPDFNNLGWDRVESMAIPKAFEEGAGLFLDSGCVGFNVHHADKVEEKTSQITCLFAWNAKDIVDRGTLKDLGVEYEENQGKSWDMFKRNIPKGMISQVLEAHSDEDRFVIAQGCHGALGAVVPFSSVDVVLCPATYEVFYAKRPELVGHSGASQPACSFEQ